MTVKDQFQYSLDGENRIAHVMSQHADQILFHLFDLFFSGDIAQYRNVTSDLLFGQENFLQ